MDHLAYAWQYLRHDRGVTLPRLAAFAIATTALACAETATVVLAFTIPLHAINGIAWCCLVNIALLAVPGICATEALMQWLNGVKLAVRLPGKITSFQDFLPGVHYVSLESNVERRLEQRVCLHGAGGEQRYVSPEYYTKRLQARFDREIVSLNGTLWIRQYEKPPQVIQF